MELPMKVKTNTKAGARRKEGYGDHIGLYNF